MSTPTITASFAASLVTFARSRGADRRSLLCAAGLSEDDLDGPDARSLSSGFGTVMTETHAKGRAR